MSRINKKKLLIGALIFFVLLLVGIGLKATQLYSSINTQKEIWGVPIPKEKTTFSMLLMGYGGAGHEGAYLTDTMMVAHIDLKENRALLISLPRDIWVQVPTSTDEEFYRKINSVYQIGLFRDNYPAVPDRYDGEQGAGELVKEIVGEIVGFEIDNYLAVDFASFRQTVDTLGGVEVDVEKAFTDPLYPVTGKQDDLCDVSPDDLEKIEELENIATESPELAYPCRYEVLHFDAGQQFMDGETALKFVRSRHALEDGGDFGRARRQQVFLEAVREKVLNIGFIPKIVPLMNDLEGNVRTDISLDLMNKFLKEFPKAREYDITQIVLTTDNYLEHSISNDGQYILVSQDGLDDWDKFHKDVEKLTQGIDPEASPTPTGTEE